ncbi:hypothetical protein, partial [Streptococcus pyogenes]|uniref:hypothetical protein n=1 Tax=Streptococcus pyogenes TaxID=1314 RepID=UPI003D9FD71F
GAGPLGRCPARQGAPANLKACFRRRTRRTRLQSARKRPDCELEQLREHERSRGSFRSLRSLS